MRQFHCVTAQYLFRPCLVLRLLCVIVFGEIIGLLARDHSDD